jgi:hypothetical protein
VETVEPSTQTEQAVPQTLAVAAAVLALLPLLTVVLAGQAL